MHRKIEISAELKQELRQRLIKRLQMCSSMLSAGSADIIEKNMISMVVQTALLYGGESVFMGISRTLMQHLLITKGLCVNCAKDPHAPGELLCASCVAEGIIAGESFEQD